MDTRPPSPYRYSVFGYKKTKRAPIIDHASKTIIDDGQSHTLLLSGSDNETMAKFFMANVKNNVKPHQWKIWIEEKK